MASIKQKFDENQAFEEEQEEENEEGEQEALGDEHTDYSFAPPLLLEEDHIRHRMNSAGKSAPFAKTPDQNPNVMIFHEKKIIAEDDDEDQYGKGRHRPQRAGSSSESKTPNTPVFLTDHNHGVRLFSPSAEVNRSPPLSMSWNQTFECFVCGFEDGFRVYNSNPLGEIFRRDFSDGGIGHAEMLFRCNYVALVGGGRNPKYPPNKVIIWDNVKKQSVIELPFKSEVKNVRLRKDKIVVILETKVLLYAFTHTPQRLIFFDTYDNPLGLGVISSDSDHSILAFPGVFRGQVQVYDVNARKAPCVVAAHEASLQCISLNKNGSLVATASEKGTLVRVFDSSSGRKIAEVRRGSDRASIHCISFNEASTRLCVSSDKSTIHVFNIESQTAAFSLPFLPMAKYFGSTWSYAKFSVGSPDSICAFAPGDDTLVLVVCQDGTFYRAKITADPIVPAISYYL